MHEKLFAFAIASVVVQRESFARFWKTTAITLSLDYIHIQLTDQEKFKRVAKSK